MPSWALLLVRSALALALAGGLAWAALKAGGREWMFLSFILSAPFAAALIAKPLIEATAEGAAWLRQRSHKEWEGNYYEFSGVQVRIFEHADLLWFCVVDIIRAVGKGKGVDGLVNTYSTGGRIVPGTKLLCLSLAGLEKNLGEGATQDALRFLVWARRDVVTPWERKRSGAMIPR
jgi:hypothetical protein